VSTVAASSHRVPATATATTATITAAVASSRAARKRNAPVVAAALISPIASRHIAEASASNLPVTIAVGT